MKVYNRKDLWKAGKEIIPDCKLNQNYMYLLMSIAFQCFINEHEIENKEVLEHIRNTLKYATTHAILPDETFEEDQ